MSSKKELQSQENSLLILEMKDLLEREGCGDEVLAKKIVEGLSAEKVFVNKYGDEIREVDWDVRLKYLTLALGIKNHRTKSMEDRLAEVDTITLQILRPSSKMIDITEAVINAE